MQPKRREFAPRIAERSGDQRTGSVAQAHSPGSDPGALAGNLRQKKKILLVDDSLTALMMSQMVLRRTSHDIVTARNGREAIDKAITERPDLIIMDVVMPQLSGFQACHRLRSIALTKDTPIILLTTRGEEESVANGFTVGCTEYMLKPVNGTELLAKVKSYLGD